MILSKTVRIAQHYAQWMSENEIFSVHREEFKNMARKIDDLTFQKCDLDSCSDVLKNFLKLLIEKERLKFFSIIVTTYVGLMNKKEGKEEGIITHAEVFSDTVKEQMIHYLNALFHKKLDITWVHDASLQKGFLFTAEYSRLDVTLKALRTLKVKKIVSSLREKFYHFQEQGSFI